MSKFLALVLPTLFLAAAFSASGSLAVLSSNPRYFTDGSGKPVYLTGVHERNDFQLSIRETSNLGSFDYTNYLEILSQKNHNFIRLWVWEDAYWTPTIYSRTGPGTAKDGKPKFDLTKFNQVFFDRLRSRVMAAHDRGIYVSIMLFQGWSINTTFYDSGIAPWSLHPFNSANNINGINGDPNGNGNGEEAQTLAIPAVTALQDAYLRKVIDTVNDLDNVLYEISNESLSSSKLWQYHMINLIHSYEAGKPKQHPVGMTSYYSHDNTDLFASPADWISPGSNTSEKYATDPPAASGSKVIIIDNDHTDASITDNTWVWKSFTRGLNPIVIDGTLNGLSIPPGKNIRTALGETKAYADKMNLASMKPSGSLSSTGYALADPGKEYIAYAPSGGSFMANLLAGTYSYEWFSPISNAVKETGSVTSSGGNKSFTPPFSGEAVLYLKSVSGGTSPTPTPSSTCSNLWTSSQSVPSGFGAAYNVLSSAKELLLGVNCSSSSAETVNVGNGSAFQYVWPQGYHWNGSSWTPYTTNCSNSVSGWCIGNASASFNLDSTQTQSVLAYICNWTGSAWKCGCHDSSCRTNYWNLQQFKQ